MIKFETWLKKQKNRDDPVGDLANDYINDGEIKPFTLEYLKMKGACKDALVAFKEAHSEYTQENYENE